MFRREPGQPPQHAAHVAAKAIGGLCVGMALMFGTNFVLAALGLPFIRAVFKPAGVAVSYLQVFHALNFIDIVLLLPLASVITATFQRFSVCSECNKEDSD